MLVAVRHVVCNNRATYVPMRFPSDPSKRRRLTHVILMNFFCVLFLQYKCHPLSWRFVVCFACEGESERGGRCDSCTCGHPSGTEREGESERGVQGGRCDRCTCGHPSGTFLWFFIWVLTLPLPCAPGNSIVLFLCRVATRLATCGKFTARSPRPTTAAAGQSQT